MGLSINTLIAAAGLLATMSTARPNTFNTRRAALISSSNALVEKRDIPARPEGVAETSFHTDQFKDLEGNGWAPAVDAAPVWMFSKLRGWVSSDVLGLTLIIILTSPFQESCYPESAEIIGADPPRPNLGTNPGTEPQGPGHNCKNPSKEYKGGYTKGDPFPNYVQSVYCEKDDTWRVNYSLYFV